MKAMCKKEGRKVDPNNLRLPSLYEIACGIGEQEKMNQIEIHKNHKNKEYVNKMIANMLHVWKYIFKDSIQYADHNM